MSSIFSLFIRIRKQYFALKRRAILKSMQQVTCDPVRDEADEDTAFLGSVDDTNEETVSLNITDD